MLKKILLTLLATTYMVLLAGCNTMHGAGEDIEKGGEKIQKESDEHK